MSESVEVFTPGSECPLCGTVGRITHTVTKLRGDRPHPRPYRWLDCPKCGRVKVHIPETCLRTHNHSP